MPDRPPSGPTLTISEAARATGLSVKAVRGRVERGTLAAVTVAGRRRIPLSELLGAGLLHTEPPSGSKRRDSGERGTPPGQATGHLELVLSRLDEIAEAVARLESELANLPKVPR